MPIRLSATSITRYKACPKQFYFADIEGLRIEDDGEARRIGTNYHELQEVYQATLAGFMGDDSSPDAAIAAAVARLNEAYKVVPDSVGDEKWAVERETLLALFMGHRWHWADDDIETIACEQKFRLPLHHPKTGLPLRQSDVIRIGKIDRVIVRNGRLMLNEYKTTSKDVGPTSDYWPRLRLDTQVSFYDLALHDGLAGGVYGDMPDLPVGGCYYDVTRKPTIKPKFLTQADTKAFIETGEYCGVGFDVVECENHPGDISFEVNEWPLEIKQGKTGFAVKETPAMYRARLVEDIKSRPEYYFARKEIVRTNKERARFRGTVYSIYRSMRFATDHDHFFENENQCDQYGGCDYRGICHYGGDVSNGQTPPGMKRVFTNLTVEKEEN